MEIFTYLSPLLLTKNPIDMDLEEFIETLAKAKYVAEIQRVEMANAIAMAFSTDEN